MGWVHELMSTILVMVTRPFSICKWVVLFGFRTMFIVMDTWVELVKSSVDLHLYMFHKMIIWMIALITLPTRVLTALQRERLLQEHLNEVQIQLERLGWDRKEIRAQLQATVKECRILESMLAEVEDENDSLISKLELLEPELQNLKVENLQLKKILNKNSWSSYTGNDTLDNEEKIVLPESDEYCVSDASSSGYKESGMPIKDLVTHKDSTWESKGMSGEEILTISKTGAVYITSQKTPDQGRGVDERREVALSQSLFSAVLSFLVGIIIWEAEDPCMPLVIALFAVVCMSLKSVFQFFSTIKNKPASDAVALLSFNWFILGTLTYPALPRVVRMSLRFFS